MYNSSNWVLNLFSHLFFFFFFCRARLQLAQDHSAHVRECSCFCLGQFAEHCQPEILDHSEEVLPIVFKLLDDATDNVKVIN